MSENDLKKVFSRNLNRILAEKDKQPIDIVNDLDISSSTVSNWCTGLKLPRAESIDMLARYLGVNRSALLVEPEERSFASERREVLYKRLRSFDEKKLDLLEKLWDVIEADIESHDGP